MSSSTNRSESAEAEGRKAGMDSGTSVVIIAALALFSPVFVRGTQLLFLRECAPVKFRASERELLTSSTQFRRRPNATTDRKAASDGMDVVLRVPERGKEKGEVDFSSMHLCSYYNTLQIHVHVQICQKRRRTGFVIPRCNFQVVSSDSISKQEDICRSRRRQREREGGL